MVGKRDDGSWLIFEFVDKEDYEIPTTERLVKVKPSIGEYVKAVRHVLEKKRVDKNHAADADANAASLTLDVHEAVVDKILALPDDAFFGRFKKEHIEAERKLQKKARARLVRQQAGDKDTAARLLRASAVSTASSTKAKAKKSNKNSKNHDEEDKSGDEDDDDSDEEEDEDEEEEEEEDEEDSDSDEEEDSDSDEEDDSDASDESDEDEDDESETSSVSAGKYRKTVDIKVYMRRSSDIRGFCVKMNTKGLATIRKSLSSDYGEKPNLFYRDTDGDVLNIRSANDLQYAFSSSRGNMQSQQNQQ